MNRTETPVAVIIADDHALIRSSIMQVLSSDEEIKVIGEACDGKELLFLARKLHPDIILTDIQMPNINGIEATRKTFCSLLLKKL